MAAQPSGDAPPAEAERNDALRTVIRQVEEDIIFGRVLPRERITEDSLIERFGVKRHIVREALAELERLGILRKERNKGAVVRDFTAEQVEQIYEVRALLQEHAAARIPLPADPGLIARLEDIHRRHSAAVAADDLRAVYRLNNAFHDTLFAACGNPYLAETIAHFAWLAHAIRSYRIADPALLAQARDEHGRMIAALKAGDRAGLVRLCVEHIGPSKEAYLRTVRLLRASGREGEGGR